MTRKGPWMLVLLFVFASTPVLVDSTQAQLEETGAAEGMICASTFEGCWHGLPNATVVLERTDGLVPSSFETVSDDSGWYAFKEIPAGTYEATVTRTGFEPGSHTIVVRADNRSSNNIPLTPLTVTTAVSLMNTDGQSVDGELNYWGDKGGSSAKISGGKGSFETTAGYHSLDVRAPGYAYQNHWVLVDGTDLSFTVKQVPPQSGTISGTIKDQDGAPVPGAFIDVYQYGGYGYDYDYEVAYEEESDPETGVSSSPHPEPYYPYNSGQNSTTTDREGRYTINVWPGEVNFNVRKEGHANRHANLAVAEGESITHDVELLKFPEKTAKVEGRIIGSDGKPLPFVSINFWSPEYGIRECSMDSSEKDRESSSISYEGEESLIYPDRYGHHCEITVFPDGRFTGNVTPGYIILEAWHDHWRSCTETSSSDGSMRRTCGPEYLGYTRTLNLQADQTTTLVVQLVARPAPDARVSGYVVDQETQKAIPGVQVHFNNEETYAWGNAETDKDGSYSVKVRSGYHRVSVWAEGYLPWQGNLFVPAKGELDLDILLKPGQETYGYCCYSYELDVIGPVMASEESAPSVDVARPASSGSDDVRAASSPSDGEGDSVEDLGGGLGPYDAKKRAAEQASSDNGAPGAGAALLVLALLGALLVLRRQQ